MQKFGLIRTASTTLNSIEKEIVREQASALGRAGKKLRLSLENYEKEYNKAIDAKQKRALIREISDNVWALLLQREFVGFIEGNLTWIQENYRIPSEAIDQLGSKQ